jgi:excisionase family DNA binding protein
MDTPIKLVSPRRLAVALELPLSWIYTQAEKGYLPHYKCGKYLRFDLGEVQAWLQQHRRGGNGQAA